MEKFLDTDISFKIEGMKRERNSKQSMFKKHEPKQSMFKKHEQLWDFTESPYDRMRGRGGSLDSTVSSSSGGSGGSGGSSGGSGDEGWNTPPREQPSPTGSNSSSNGSQDWNSMKEIAMLVHQQQQQQEEETYKRRETRRSSMVHQQQQQQETHKQKGTRRSSTGDLQQYHSKKGAGVNLLKLSPVKLSPQVMRQCKIVKAKSDTKARLQIVDTRKDIVQSMENPVHPYARDSYPNDAGLRRRSLHCVKGKVRAGKATVARRSLASKEKPVSCEKFVLKYIPVYQADDGIDTTKVKKGRQEGTKTLQYAKNSFPLRRKLTRQPLQRKFKYIPVYQA